MSPPATDTHSTLASKNQNSVVGHVFDVSQGAEYYAPGQGYDFFTFRDGSRAFVTGTFTEVWGAQAHGPVQCTHVLCIPLSLLLSHTFTYTSHSHSLSLSTIYITHQEGLTDDLTGLSPGECQAVLRWLRFFQEKANYPYAGRLTGTFFSPGNGGLLPSYLAFRECAYQTAVQRCVGSLRGAPCSALRGCFLFITVFLTLSPGSKRHAATTSPPPARPAGPRMKGRPCGARRPGWCRGESAGRPAACAWTRPRRARTTRGSWRRLPGVSRMQTAAPIDDGEGEEEAAVDCWLCPVGQKKKSKSERLEAWFGFARRLWFAFARCLPSIASTLSLSLFFLHRNSLRPFVPLCPSPVHDFFPYLFPIYRTHITCRPARTGRLAAISNQFTDCLTD